MLTNHLKFSLRSLMRQKGYALLNILGLGLGLALFLLIAIYVKSELSTDRFHEHYHRLHRLETTDYAITPSMTAGFLATALPEALEICRVAPYYGRPLMKTDDVSVKLGSLMLADSTFFSMFSFNLIHGDPATVLSRPLSMVLSQSEAIKLFGDTDPIGKTLDMDNRLTFEVTGVMTDLPSNSIFKGTAIAPFHALVPLTNDPNALNDWNNWNYATFVLLPGEFNLAAINEKLKEGMNQMARETFGFEDIDIGFFLRPFSDIYFNRDIPSDNFPKGNKTFILIYVAIGVFILFIAIINFINLSTAMASRRSREVGLKKVLGSSRGTLVRQYLSESIFLSLAALLLALLLFELLLPAYNQVANVGIDFNFFQEPLLLLAALLLAMLVGATAGIYPALYLSHFEPITVLKGELTSGKKGSALRKTLIIFQFTISIAIILCTIVIYRQLQYARTMDLGFNKENIIYFTGSGEIPRNYEAFKNDLKQLPGVDFVGVSNSIPGYVGMGWGRVVDTVERRISALPCDPEFLKVYDLKITRGRAFDSTIPTDINNSFILNETAVRQFGLENPVGVRFWDGKVIGVVDDFAFVSVHHKMGPLVLAYMPEWCSYINVRLNGQNTSATIDQIGEIWKSYAPDFPFNYRFLDEAIGRLYEKEKRLTQLFLFFSFLAIFVACLGLSGLALFTTQQRTREMGIRKVFGSSTRNILALLTGDFLRWVVLANLIAWPIAWYAMNRWLENFAYRIRIQWWMFAAAAAIALFIALATISIQALRAARKNPVDALKYE